MNLNSRPLIDAFVEHKWRNDSEVAAYLPAAWREYLGRPGILPDGGGMMPITPESPYYNPFGGTHPDAAAPEGGPIGSSAQTTASDLLDKHNITKAVLGLWSRARLLPGHLNHHFAREMIRATNDWTVEQWLSGTDERFHGLILVQNQLPDVAAAEIHRLADNPRMVGVLFGGNGLAQPFGHPIYDPIHRAAAEHNLPIVIPAGTDLAVEVLTEGTAGGPASMYSESQMLASSSLMTHVSSFVGQGVFEKYPNLKLHVVGGGVTWAVWLLWRFNAEYRAFRREVPWLKRQPGDYMIDHVRLSTLPLEAYKSPEAWQRVFDALPELPQMMTYASGYPTYEFDSPEKVAGALPEQVHSSVFEANAQDLYRWPSSSGTLVSAKQHLSA